jgi:hypothetical protein
MFTAGLTRFQAVLFRSLCVLDSVRVGDIVAVSSPPLPLEACALFSTPPSKSAGNSASPLGIRRVAAVAGDELIASDDGEVMVVPPGCVWLTCDNSSGDLNARADSRLVGPVSVYNIFGRALSVVSGGRTAALSISALSISEDMEWSRSGIVIICGFFVSFTFFCSVVQAFAASSKA